MGNFLRLGFSESHLEAIKLIARLESLASHWVPALDAQVVTRARIWSNVAAGELSTSRAELSAAASRASANGEVLAATLLRQGVVRLQAPAIALGPLEELALRTEHRVVPITILDARFSTSRNQH